MDDHQCGTCTFYRPVDQPKNVAPFGQCRRHPPGLIPLGLSRRGDGDEILVDRAKWGFPHVPPDHPCCGDYFPATSIRAQADGYPGALLSVPISLVGDFRQDRKKVLEREERGCGPVELKLYREDEPGAGRVVDDEAKQKCPPGHREKYDDRNEFCGYEPYPQSGRDE